MGNGLNSRWAGRRGRWTAVAVGVVVVLLAGAGTVRALTAGAAHTPVAPATAVVDRGPVAAQVATAGTVQPAQTRSLSFSVAGTVTSVSVRPGTVVRAGQALARIDDADARQSLSTAQGALQEAEDALDAAEQTATAAPTAGTCPSRGTDVAAAYAVGHPTTPPTTQPPSTRPTTRPSTASPTPTVRPSGPPTPPRSSGPPSPPRSSSPSHPGTPGRSTTPGRPAGPTGTPAPSPCPSRGASGGTGNAGSGGDPVLSAQQRVTQANLTVQSARDAVDGTTITAPIAGRILSVAGKVGSQVGGGATFVSLADIFDMQVSAAFPEADADRLADRQRATVTLANHPGDQLGATVAQVDPVGTSDGTMVRYGVLLSFDHAPADLLVGQSAAVRVTTGSAADVLRVPSTAVHDVTGTSATVLMAAGAGDRRRSVQVGLRGDQYTEITSGLQAGDQVVRSW